MKGLWTLIVVVMVPLPVLAQGAEETRVLYATPVNPHAPRIDGRLDDAVWEKARFISGDVQKEPDEGVATTQRTELALIYCGGAPYVGVRMHSPGRDHVRVDSSQTYLAGYAGMIQWSKNSGRHWVGNVGANAFSPGFEINDAGYFCGTDGSTIDETTPGMYGVTDGGDTFTISRPDFTVLSCRSNAVRRWE